MMSDGADLLDALSRLEKDITEAEGRVAEAEQHLAGLRAMRDNIQPFIEQYVTTTKTFRVWGGDGGRDATEEEESAGGAPTYVDMVVEVLHQHPGPVFDVDEVVNLLRENGSRIDRVRVRNSLNYAVRLGKIYRGSRRGTYAAARDTSTPAATGVEVNEESDLEGSSREEGDRDESSIPLHDQVGDAHDAQNHLDRVGDRASMIGG